MKPKTPGKTFWNDLKDWAKKNSDQYVYVEIPSESTDLDEDVSPLKAREGYFRVLLTDVSLGGSGDALDRLSPTLLASVKLKYGDRGIINLNRVVPVTNEARTSERPTRYQITELMPYVGGKVEVAAGLLALPRLGREVVETTLNFFNEVTGFETASLIDVSQAAELSAIVDSGVKALMESAGGHIYLGMHHASEGVQALRPGYIAAVIAKPEQINPAQFSVKEGRLYYREGAGSAPRPLEGFDYMLFQIEVREEREDWQIKSVREPLGKAVRALLRGNQTEADNYRMLALSTACQSADLTVADRRRLTLAISEELKSLKDIGRGAVGVEERDLNQIMSARAMPLQLARNKPGITFSEVAMIEILGAFPSGGVSTGISEFPAGIVLDGERLEAEGESE